ncbi:DUF2779 domain-containing protein [Pseudohalocynthiibacter aestuariivivens]|uniref:DUF2779 domain-containing protein n=1 Tax=Pseudohalocynthiibacter aestuariivivens TaxID=1591409 RepID=A0ABV5JGG1_9RHOB|nr:DUF2779 domain-containing protein [Pseudohalocynthiibacter aestuariivivens]MBS9718495.1 DUF2779 domain-containing protein [Pseudohalocynthiibacter aestuariivivens]
MAEPKLTKSDFLEYRHCAKAFWLKKNKPDAVHWPTPTAFDRLLMMDGQAVEVEARKLVESWDGGPYEFQVTFDSPDGLLARADLVERLDDGQIDLFEVKASTSLKSSSGANHIVDAAFQTLVAEQSGASVRKAFIIHVNGDYVRKGDVDPEGLLRIVEVTKEVRSLLPKLEDEVVKALALVSEETIDENGCSCRFIGSREKQCAAFDYFNPDVPDLSIYLLPRVSKTVLEKFVGEGRLALTDLDVSEVTNLQKPVLMAAKTGQPQVNKKLITKFLNALEWPLYFYDYETFASAIPMYEGFSPHKAMPVQYSLHVLEENGELSHREFLSDRPGEQRELVEQLSKEIGDFGSLVSWNKQFEIGCNKCLAKMFPDYAEFLDALNERTVDLMTVFKASYVDIGFEGSTSIKKVLPVVCPDLKYNEDAVHDGGGAMAAWLALVETKDEEERQGIATELREYCELDTLAMVEIYRFLADDVLGEPER